MPTLIKWTGQDAQAVDDPYTWVPDENHVPRGDVIVSLQRFQSEGHRLLAEGRNVGVRLEPNEQVEDLAADLPKISVVALAFPKFLQGQAYSSARILREQAGFMVRCGIDAFEVADGSSPEQWRHVVGRFRHVYQRAADGREPAFVERMSFAQGAS